MKHDYTKLDAAILARIAELGCATFTRLQSGDVQMISEEAAAEHNKTVALKWKLKPGWRFIDARLQALRKAGRIRYQRQPEGWVLAA